MTLSIRVRPAIPSDKEPILAFCRNTWPGGDYIPEVWDDWLRDRKGRVVVATSGKTPVGVAHCYFQTKTDAWLEGVRVHPEYRGQGIAGKLNKALFAYAVREGAKVARLCTDADNEASRKHLTRTGFKAVQEFARYMADRPLKRKPAKSMVRKWRNPSKTDVGRILNSMGYSRYGGLYAAGWTWYPLDAKAVRKLASRGSILRLNRGPESSFSILQMDQKGPRIGFVSGTADDVEAHARYARNILSSFKPRLRRARFSVPQHRPWLKAVKAAGYERKGATVVYQRKASA